MSLPRSHLSVALPISPKWLDVMRICPCFHHNWLLLWPLNSLFMCKTSSLLISSNWKARHTGYIELSYSQQWYTIYQLLPSETGYIPFPDSHSNHGHGTQRKCWLAGTPGGLARVFQLHDHLLQCSRNCADNQVCFWSPLAEGRMGVRDPGDAWAVIIFSESLYTLLPCEIIAASEKIRTVKMNNLMILVWHLKISWTYGWSIEK